MPVSFLPGAITRRVTDLSGQWLRERGIRLLMLDFDNTLLPYTKNKPSRELLSWLEDVQKSGISLCVVSNSRRSRVQDFCSRYGIACISRARKPFTTGIRACMRRFDCGKQDCALVGDQIFTDVLGANAAGVFSILVKAIDNHNIWLKLRHIAELPFIYAARKRRI